MSMSMREARERDRETSLNRSLVWHPFKERERERERKESLCSLTVCPTGGDRGRESKQSFNELASSGDRGRQEVGEEGRTRPISKGRKKGRHICPTDHDDQLLSLFRRESSKAGCRFAFRRRHFIRLPRR